MVFALAFHLCLRAGERVTRDDLVETFWGTGDVTNGRHSLRQMLYRLRQRGFELDAESENLFLDPARVDCDLTRVLAEEWPESADAAGVEEAGLPTPNFSRRVSDRFHEWYDGVRSRVARQHRRAALRQIVRARREGRWADLERWAQQVLVTDPLNEEATLARAESAAMAGSKAMALEIIDQYMEELGDRAPQIGLPATVLRRRIAERRPEWSTRGPREVPLVGREELMARLTGMVDAAGRGEGRAVVLWGAPGVGKTRVASETINFAELSGFRCVRVRAPVESAARPLSAVLALVPLLTELPGAAGCHPSTVALLTRASKHQREASALDPLPIAASLDGALTLALQDLFEAVSAECRVLISLDDIHNADTASRSVLNAVIGRTRTLRVVWIATSRVRGVQSETSPKPPAGLLEELLVSPLERASSIALAESLCNLDGLPLDASDHGRIVSAAGGNPLFVRELTYHSAKNSDGAELPRSLREVMDERLSHIGAEHTRLLRVIALLGAHSTVGRLRAITGMDSAHLTLGLESLEQEGMLRLSPSFGLDLHECWHAAVAERTSPVVRASLSHDCALVLTSEGGSLDSDQRNWRAAELFAESGDANRSVALFTQVADQMFARGLVTEAALIYERALAVCGLERAPLSMRVRHARALFACERLPEVLAACDGTYSTHGGGPSDFGSAASLACLKLDTLTKLRLDHRAALEAVSVMASDVRVPSQARQVACLTGIIVAFNDTGSPHEEHFYRTSSTLAQQTEPTVISALVAMIYHAEHGDLTGVDSTERLLLSLESEPITDQLRCRAMRIRANAHRWAGNRHLCFEIGARAFEIAQTTGLIGDAAIAAELMTFMALDDADEESVMHWLPVWERCLPPNAYFERANALAHAKSRVLINSGAYVAAFEQLESASSAAGTDPLGKRRAVDYAAAALCLAMMGRGARSIEAINSSLHVAEQSRPSTHVDCIVELALRALHALGEEDRVETVANDYIDRRRRYPFPIARAFTMLALKSGARLQNRLP